MASYTCYQERREEREARMREYYEINQREPPNLHMMPERQFARLNRLDPIQEELEESF
jgi:hypothetical protein